jgi:methionyl-tRNA synthetase
MAYVTLVHMVWSEYCDICGHDVFVNEYRPVCVRCRGEDRILKSETQWHIDLHAEHPRLRSYRKVTA